MPGTPNALNSSVVNSSALFVSWAEPSPVNGIITSYDLYYSISTFGNCSTIGTSQHIPSAPGQTTYNATLTNLVPFSMYALCVQASTRIGPGALTTAVVITTDPDISSPPTNFTATAVSSTSIKLTWGYPQSPRGLIAGYQIMHNTSLSFNPVNIAISTNDSSQQSYTFSGLIPYTAYIYAVRACGYLIRLNMQIYGTYSQQPVSTLQDGMFILILACTMCIYFDIRNIPFHSSLNATKLPALCSHFQCPYGKLDTSILTQWDCDRLHSVLYRITEPDLS